VEIEYTANEARVRVATATGEVADFSDTARGDASRKPGISAAFLRRLMLGLEYDASGRRIEALLPGVRIKGARLEGILDLTDCAGAGGAGLPALSLEYCDLPDRIDLSNGRLARLSISDSRFRDLWGIGLQIDGDFSFDRATPLPTANGGDDTSYIRLRAARIGGDVWGDAAHLNSPDAIPQGMEIKPSALSMQAADIAGVVSLSNGFFAKGGTWLLGVRIGGTLQCIGGRFSNPGEIALLAANAEIGGDVRLLTTNVDQRFEAEGAVFLSGTKIGRSLICDGGRFANAGGQALIAENVEIGGDVRLSVDVDQRFEAEGVVWLTGAKIGRSLVCNGGLFSNHGGNALMVRNAEIGSAVMLGANGNQRFEADGAVWLMGTRIGGDLRCEGGRFASAGGDALIAANARIGGEVILGADGDNRFEAEGTVSLMGATVGGSLACDGARFANAGRVALLAENTEIGGAVLLRAANGAHFEAEGMVSLMGAKVARDLELTDARLKHAGYALILQTARIQGQLSARNNSIEGSVVLAGLRIARLLDDPATAWGDPDANTQIDLNEIDLDMIGALPLDSRPLWRARARWLRRNTGEFMGNKGLSKFSNQPWRQVAGAFERAGLHRDARRIRREEQREANKFRPLWQRPFVSIFADFMFGFGLSASRAAATALIVWSIGIAGAVLMNARGALVIAQGPEKSALVCENFQPPLYALDVALPVLDLKQEIACEPGRAPGAQLLPGIATPFGMLFEEIALWTWAKALYAVIGALVAGFALLTWSGMFKPRAEL
jgi:hypothetical protein